MRIHGDGSCVYQGKTWPTLLDALRAMWPNEKRPSLMAQRRGRARKK